MEEKVLVEAIETGNGKKKTFLCQFGFLKGRDYYVVRSGVLGGGEREERGEGEWAFIEASQLLDAMDDYDEVLTILGAYIY